MAKQLVNPIERHLEKGVLGLAGFLLIGAIGGYLVTSPNQLELGGESVSPSTIDQKLAQKAADVRDRIERAPANVEMPETLSEVFGDELDPFQRTKLPLTLPAAVTIGPEVPIIDPPEAALGQAKLVKVVPAGKPAATTGRSTFLIVDPTGEESYLPTNWVTVSVVFNVKEQMAEQQREYGAARKEIIFGLVELQRRARHVNGSWSDEDWENVEPWPAGRVPAIPSVPLVDQDGQIVVPREDQDRLESFFKELREPAEQLELIRPLMPEIENGDRWSFPVITSYRDVLMQDDQYLNPNEPPSSDPVDRYAKEELQQTIEVEQLSAAERLAKLFQEARRFLKSARENQSEDDATRAYNIAFDIKQDDEARASDKNEADRLMEEADLLQGDIRRRKRRGLIGRPPPQPGAQDNGKPERQPLPTQQIWVHDAKPGSVESGKVYQYRLRPSIYNRLAGQPDKFRNKADAKRVFISGEWTEPTEVTIPRDTLFFITSKDERKKEVSIEFYKWEEGVWVKSRRFKYTVGDMLQGESRTQVPAFDDPTVAERALVAFGADATLIDIDFDRTYRERKRGPGRTGVRFAAPSTACSVVFVDAAGLLHERFVPTEKSHPDKRAIQVWSPPKKE